MRVLFDHQIFYYKYGGAVKYFSKLLQYLPEGIGFTTAIHPYAEYLKDVANIKTYEKSFRGDSVVAELLNRPYTDYKLMEGKYDVYHQTNFSTECLKYAGHKPVVTTFHDSNFISRDPHPEIVKRQKISMKRADVIVCVSENTKKDLLTFFDVDEKKVHVIYHGVDSVGASFSNKDRIIRGKYVLYVGRRSEYKNFKVMARAFAEIHKQDPSVSLVCTYPSFTEAEMENFKELGIEKSVICVRATEEDMSRLYRDAEVFVFPSLYEGFGMPILEAWNCHCPVILSKASCFPEIASEAATYFEPEDYCQLAEKVLEIIGNKELRKKYVGLGDERVRLFSWENCAKRHQELYESLI